MLDSAICGPVRAVSHSLQAAMGRAKNSGARAAAMGHVKHKRGGGGGGGVPNPRKPRPGDDEDAGKRGRNTWESKERLRRKLKVTQLQRLLKKEESTLRRYRNPNDGPAKKKRKKKKGRLGYETWKLRGAARPADTLIDTFEDYNDPHAGTVDMFTLHMGSFSSHPQTKVYLDLLTQLAVACGEAGFTRKEAETYERVLQIDAEDKDNCRHLYVMSLLDRGEAGKARALIERFSATDTGTVMTYSMVLVEVVSWMALEEAGASEALATSAIERAYLANPYALVCLSYASIFEDVVEYADEINPAKCVPGSVQEAIWYCCRQEVKSPWSELEGGEEWLRSILKEKFGMPPAPAIVPRNGSEQADESDMGGINISMDEKNGLDSGMFVEMYNTAVEMTEQEEEGEEEQMRR